MLNIQVFKNFGDYFDSNLPSVIYAPRNRLALAAIHSANPSHDYSFSVVDSKGALAYCLLYVDVNKEIPHVWGVCGPATLWLTGRCTEDMQHDVLSLAAMHVKKVLQNFSVATIAYADYFRCTELMPLTAFLMQQYNCTATLSFSSIIDLSAPQDVLRHRLRERYKATINKGLREYDFEIVDGKTVQRSHIEALHQCHITASGRNVYNDFFWETWQNECEAEAAFMVLAIKANTARGGIFCSMVKGRAYYSIGAFDRSLGKTGLSHACMWKAILYAKQIGLREFEVGRTDFDCLHPDISEKEQTIGFFKRGFGGRNRPVLYLNVTKDCKTNNFQTSIVGN